MVLSPVSVPIFILFWFNDSLIDNIIIIVDHVYLYIMFYHGYHGYLCIPSNNNNIIIIVDHVYLYI